jgi:hypothetical protein
MDMTFRPATPAERNYTYSQSQQISMQTGCIGHLRGDMDTDGNGFFTSWDDFRKDLKTQEFKDEFDSVINTLRFDEQYGGVLKNRSALSSYCMDHIESSFAGNYCHEYAFRADTEKYAYIFRLNPNKGDYNLYCYCYVREWLDKHLTNAERGIRFITPDYKEVFRIPDGDKVRITRSDGETVDRTCRFIDDYHVEVGNNLYHICEFAERMEQAGNTVVPLRSSLPEKCYSTLLDTGNVVILKRGETGYYKTDIPYASKDEAKALVSEYNRKLGVSKGQEEAMRAGSMFGFHVPGADPKNYDENGQPIKPKHRDRGDAR